MSIVSPNLSTANTPKEKVVVAFSGGLDTSTILPWLQENHPCDIIAVCVDVGQCQPGEAEEIEQKALDFGAVKSMVLDVTEEFVTDYVWPCVQAGAVYEKAYLLGTAMARPLIAQKLVEVALQEGATAICHGATGKGNDQVRFELAIKALAPQLKIIAPWRMWDLQSRDDEMQYLIERGYPVPMSKADSYSRDENIWHISHEGLELEDPAQEPDYPKILKHCKPLEQTPDTPTYIEITFEKGVPVQLNGETLNPVELLNQLNTLAGINGIGVMDMIENRVVGMKSRGIYETPGGTLLYKAHDILEQLCLDKKMASVKNKMAQTYAELIYDGHWFTPLRKAVQTFLQESQNTVTGTVKLKLYKGNMTPAGVTSPFSLYSESLASFDTGELFNHHDAEGFINLYGLPAKVQGMINPAQNYNISSSSLVRGTP